MKATPRVLTAVALWTVALGCKAQVPVISEPFVDDFERGDLGPSWLDTGSVYRVAAGKLSVSKAYNHPLWLRRKLPRDVVIEFDAMSRSPEGDLKVELFGDGESFDPDKNTYDPTSYVLFFGGHGNTESVIGRLGEHGEQIKATRTDVKVVPGKWYHWSITRKGGKLDWTIDGKPFLSWTDPAPLAGSGHEYFAINNWETDVTFDNLRIRPAN